MIDLYLKFTDEVASTAVLYTKDCPNFANIDTIGTIYKPTGEVDAEGSPMMILLDGWHVNVRVVNEDATSLEAYVVTPTAPMRVWA